jgi:hypothetical protein
MPTNKSYSFSPTNSQKEWWAMITAFSGAPQRSLIPYAHSVKGIGLVFTVKKLADHGSS